MRERDPESRKRLLLDAALTEFAARGLAGARIERIAAGARCSAGLVYAHFGSKDALFDAVLADAVDRTLHQVPVVADDLPGYAARLYDVTAAAPDVERLLAWHRLEREPQSPCLPAVTEATRATVDAVAAAQRAGAVPDRFDAPELVLAVQTIARMWITPPVGVLPAAIVTEDHGHRRRAVHAAVSALLAA
ncbi:TetR family transcriptional regulator [Modestobacter lacusdianchii]